MSNPILASRAHGSRIASCSTEDMIICDEGCFVAAPKSAVLFDSVPPEVNNISELSAFMSEAICRLAFSTALLAVLPCR